MNNHYNIKDPASIFEYSKLLMGESLHSLLGDEVIKNYVAEKGLLRGKNKGALGNMVEELFFKYSPNSNPVADFEKAGLELKCTPLLKSKEEKKADHNEYRIKERLVCGMIDYFEIAKTDFNQSHIYLKCRLMLLLFYLHIPDLEKYDLKFIFRVLWEIPEKDLIIIRNDYNTIANKIKSGNAHLLSEGDTIYLGACRKGKKGDAPQAQPFSTVMANKRAFSLKPAYMRYILSHVQNSESNHYSNYRGKEAKHLELVSTADLTTNSFEQVIINRFKLYIGKNYTQICEALDKRSTQAKSKYADVSGLIASNGSKTRISHAEEFQKSGIQMKTIRINASGMPEESMSFKNIDYCEVYENDNWIDSEAYEIFTGRFLFVVYKQIKGKQIRVFNKKTNNYVYENSYILDKVFFWTMPPKDLLQAKKYWEDIRKNILANNIHRDAFWRLSQKRYFHVRPKGRKSTDKAVNPHGGVCDKLCYWMNAAYIKKIIETIDCNE